MENESKSKGIAAMLVSKMGPKEGEHEEEQGEEEGLNAAAEDIMSAIHDKDPNALKNALRDFWNMC